MTHRTTRFLPALLLGALAALAGCQSQATFQTPQDAAKALDAAVRTQDRAQLHRLFGEQADELRSGDEQQDRDDLVVFARKVEAGCEVKMDGQEGATLLIGPDKDPFAVPLVKGTDGWRFDTAAGVEEVENRRIGRNELQTIEALRTLVDAQAQFFAADPDGDGVKQYAQRLMSSPGKKDGLYWPAAGGEEPSPIGPVLAEAAARRDGAGQRMPFNGYLYRLLRAQGPAAPGGAKSYEKDGRLTGGWAVVASPADYGRTGVMTFIASDAGVIYQRDLGEQTEQDAKAMESFDPGAGWTRVP